MRESVARNLRCQWKPMAQCLGLAGGLTAFLCLCCVFCAPIDAIARTVMVCFGPFAAASWLMTGIGMSINFYTQSAFLYLMMGTTRAGIFVVRQLANLLFCAVGALAVTAGLAAMGMWTEGMYAAPLAFFGALFLACDLTELFGLLAYRYGKWGMFFYALGILLLGGVSGFFVGVVAGDQRAQTLQILLRWASGLPFVALSALLLLGGALTAAMSWAFFRRAQVKV